MAYSTALHLKSRCMRVFLRALLVISILTVLVPPLPASALTYVDRFDPPPFEGHTSSFVTGSPERGLVYTSSDAEFIALQRSVYTFGRTVITARNGGEFQVTRVVIDNIGNENPIVISGFGPEPFTRSVWPNSIAGVYLSSSTVTRIEIDGQNPDELLTYSLQEVNVSIPSPDLTVIGNGQTIADGDTTPSLEDFTDFGSWDVGSGSAQRTFTIQSSGDLDLQLDGSPVVTLSGSSDFSILSQPSLTSLPAGSSTSFTLSCTPSDYGERTAEVGIGSTLSSSPHTFVVQCTGTGGPEMDVLRPDGSSIPDGGEDRLGELPPGTVSRTYTLDNRMGHADLEITAIDVGNQVNVSGVTVDPGGVLTVPAGDVSSLVFTFDIDTSGSFRLDAAFETNDPDDSLYEITLSSSGLTPQIDVQRPMGVSIPDGGEDTIGQPGVGAVHLAYTIDNNGGVEPLVVDGITAVNLSNTSNVQSLTTFPMTVPVGGVRSLDLAFETDAPGNFGFDLDIASNDAVTSVYDIHIAGSASDLAVRMEQSSPAEGEVLLSGVTELFVAFNKPAQSGGGASAADNTANYLLVEAGVNGVLDTTSCLAGRAPDDVLVPINAAIYDASALAATLQINNGRSLSNGNYRLLICGTTSIVDLYGMELNGGAADSRIDFQVALPDELPATGFAPFRVTALAAQPDGAGYQSADGMTLTIPSLGVDAPIAAVPHEAAGWDVAWLGDDVGYLEGTAFPTWAGNTVLTGHVYGADGLPGPFEGISELGWGDRMEIHAYGQNYTYEVRSVRTTVSPSDLRELNRHEEFDWITLITCQGYDAASESYRYRTVVRAVLVYVSAD